MKKNIGFNVLSLFIIFIFSFIGYFVFSSYSNPERLADQSIQLRDRLNQNFIFFSQNPKTLTLSYNNKANTVVQNCFKITGSCQMGEFYPFSLVNEFDIAFSSHPQINTNDGLYDIIGEPCSGGDDCVMKVESEISCLKNCDNIKKAELKLRYKIVMTEVWQVKLKEHVVNSIESVINLPTLESFDKKIPRRKNLKSNSGQDVNQIGGYGD